MSNNVVVSYTIQHKNMLDELLAAVFTIAAAANSSDVKEECRRSVDSCFQTITNTLGSTLIGVDRTIGNKKINFQTFKFKNGTLRTNPQTPHFQLMSEDGQLVSEIIFCY